jgi:uncharacterized membrane protein
MLQPIVIYVTGLAGFLALDAVWLSTMAPRVYKPAMGDLVAPGVNLGAAALFYLIYGVGIVAFAVMPALGAGRWTTAFALGALLGLVAYGTYDLTNHATLRNWPMIVTVLDMAWGTLATALAATFAYAVASRWLMN